jgi:hypothetical protein
LGVLAETLELLANTTRQRLLVAASLLATVVVVSVII